ncbi:hemin-degrading factor [Szabonella alba]|uniref:Hemin-degrading factor n=1 Tax=Szabonella alba TaxID=2804194 RepID=A0A8K0V9L5_9RHOB|nr:ChuX/HutX family heme-like substrate-binding protein [Szabonella alba]MBL4916911.1 hemin-degrading factor [Szabonella alba]
MAHLPDPAPIRALRLENPKARARDLAHANGLTEAQLVAAHVGHGATVIDAVPDRLIPLVAALGDVMALTRNESCVHERRGTYGDYHPGAHAQMVLGSEIDLRIFPSHWVHGFAVEETGADGVKRSVQIFDAAGDAVHKVHLKPESDADAFAALVAALRRDDQSQILTLAPRKPAQPAKSDPSKAEALRAEWDTMTDTHQFLRLVGRLKMNRLGAYQIAGAPRAQRLDPQSVTEALHAAADGQIPVMIFVGNMGCIQIHGGPIERVVPMGPWINVMDPRFNLHLRGDRIAEVWLVEKPTKRGPAISIEAFDAEGEIILQIFGYRKDAPPDAWDAMVRTLPLLEEVPA